MSRLFSMGLGLAEESKDFMSRFLIMLVCAGVGFGAAFLALRWILAFCERWPSLTGARDFHHIHNTSVPRLGGLALVLAFLAVALAVVVIAPETFGEALKPGVVIGSSVAMFLLGFWDDLRPLGAVWMSSTVRAKAWARSSTSMSGGLSLPWCGWWA